MTPPRASAKPNRIVDAVSNATAKLRAEAIEKPDFEAARRNPARSIADDVEDLRDKNGTGDQADEAQLGVTKEEVKDLANDAEGG
jgi:hypothetical protein